MISETTTKTVKGDSLVCLRCGYGNEPTKPWIQRRDEPPAQCWKCKTPYWNKRRRYESSPEMNKAFSEVYDALEDLLDINQSNPTSYESNQAWQHLVEKANSVLEFWKTSRATLSAVVVALVLLSGCSLPCTYNGKAVPRSDVEHMKVLGMDVQCP